ncbi:hypothetical protein GOBAR_AA22667 [Gossypium barbadense]|uniref:Oleosin n=1 Tax=Gossypium barbadense TaxID=3634 RepID=A0A2P5X3W1_GOSBA|nr:hypothetical protein GOBAR_AA22667 [Gossypium barbadense]
MAELRPIHQRSTVTSFLRKIKAHTPDSAQLFGLLALFIFASILIILTGLTVTATILVGTVLFVTIAGFLSACSFGAVAVAGLSWTYRYFNGMLPARSDKVANVRRRIYNTNTYVKHYAMEYGVKMIA